MPEGFLWIFAEDLSAAMQILIFIENDASSSKLHSINASAKTLACVDGTGWEDCERFHRFHDHMVISFFPHKQEVFYTFTALPAVPELTLSFPVPSAHHI